MKKLAKDLEPRDRIQFYSTDLMTNDGHPVPLQAEVLRLVPVYPGDRIMIFTVSGALFPVATEKEFELAEGDYDPEATQMPYATEVGPAEMFQNVSIE